MKTILVASLCLFFLSIAIGLEASRELREDFQHFEPKKIPFFFYEHHKKLEDGVSNDGMISNQKEKSAFEHFEPKKIPFFFYEHHKKLEDGVDNDGMISNQEEKSAFEHFEPKTIPFFFYEHHKKLEDGVDDDGMISNQEEKSAFEHFEPKKIPFFFYEHHKKLEDGVANDGIISYPEEKSAFKHFEPKNIPFFFYEHHKRLDDGVNNAGMISNEEEEKSGINGKNSVAVINDDVLRVHSMDGHKHMEVNSIDHDDSDLQPSFVTYFTKNDLKVGNKWASNFQPPNYSGNSPPLLSKEKAETIPFSSKQLPYILKSFSYSPDSPQAKAVESALTLCETKPIAGETLYCATSFESMLDFVRSKLGSETKFKSITSTLLSKSKGIIQNYTIVEEPEEILVPRFVSCHPVSYPYEVFGCHTTTKTKPFQVSLAGENGDKIEAIGLCHMDTSKWEPDHQSFKEIGSKPGLTEVCHFFSVDNMMWIPF